MLKSNRNIIIVVLATLVVLIAGLAASALYFQQNEKTKFLNQALESNQLELKTNNLTPEETKIEPVAKTALFSGKIKKLDQDLGLIHKSFDPIYFNAGKFLDGKYKDYDRIVLHYTTYGAKASTDYIFVTKDNQKYTLINATSKNSFPAIGTAKTLDEASEDISDINLDDNSFKTWFDTSKVVGIDTAIDEFPETIKLDSNFSLVKNSLALLDYRESFEGFIPGKNDVAPLDLSKFTKLTIPNYDKEIYFTPYKSDAQDPQPYEKFILQQSSFLIADSTGLASNYTLALNRSVADFPIAIQKYNSDKAVLADYNKLSSQTTDDLIKKGVADDKLADERVKKIGPSPEYPQLAYPSTELNKTTLKGLGNGFSLYSTAFPGACGIDTNASTIIQNIQDSELSKIGSSDNLDLFKLKDSNHPLYKAQYDLKVANLNSSTDKTPNDDFVQANPGIKKPTLYEYVAKNPLLFFKDPFDRLAVLGEYEYLMVGGCGKPVIYLYPKQEMTINVKFLAPIQLTTDIPKYNLAKGWNVLAKPNGQLQDLQPEYTNCDIFDTDHVGSKYAKNACQTNNYPYIYWSGNRLGADYPKQNQGWIIAKSEIPNFLNTKLDELGFNKTEKSDMIEYWLPYLQARKGEYFRLSFLQNTELNQFLPTQISPKPDRYFRVFLDWDNFDQKPGVTIEPQVLQKLINRSGFMAVEWGGLKK